MVTKLAKSLHVRVAFVIEEGVHAVLSGKGEKGMTERRQEVCRAYFNTVLSNLSDGSPRVILNKRVITRRAAREESVKEENTTERIVRGSGVNNATTSAKDITKVPRGTSRLKTGLKDATRNEEILEVMEQLGVKARATKCTSSIFN